MTSHPIDTTPAWPARAWRALAARCAQAWRFRRDLQALSALDDQQLKDIGLRRSEIARTVCRGPLA